MPKRSPHLSQCVTAGSFVFLSGQLALDSTGALIGSDITTQTEHCLYNVEQHLHTQGLSLSNVVKSTVWLSRLADFQRFNDAYAQKFGDNRPARSTVIAELVIPGALIEIEVVAARQT